MRRAPSNGKKERRGDNPSTAHHVVTSPQCWDQPTLTCLPVCERTLWIYRRSQSFQAKMTNLANRHHRFSSIRSVRICHADIYYILYICRVYIFVYMYKVQIHIYIYIYIYTDVCEAILLRVQLSRKNDFSQASPQRVN